MRDLLLMRGAPGCGKSTFIKEHNLDVYTICPDKIRLLYESPIYDQRTCKKSISQKNDRKVWKLVNELVENRMINGDFIVIDAMNVDILSWKKLAEKYRYRIWYKSFDVSLEECIDRNNKREEYKQVPEDVIRNAYERILNTSVPQYAKEIDETFFDGIKPLNVDQYDNLYIFGDIHGCFEPLNNFFKENAFSEDNLYVFCGDYLDRGFENKETIEFLMQFTTYKNVMFLEGNHCWEKYWANDEFDKIRSKEFLTNTVSQINSVDKSKIRDWCRRWIQMAYLEYDNKKYFITHAGLGFFPGEKELRFVASHEMIRGGKYEDDIDQWYNGESSDVIQIHGHRNLYEYLPNQFAKSINLNSAVEFGEPLRVMKIFKGGFDFLYYENPKYIGRDNPWKRNKALESNSGNGLTEMDNFIINMRKSSDIVEKTLANGISSFNFKRDVFFSDKWNNLNKIARGLFVDVIKTLLSFLKRI